MTVEIPAEPTHEILMFLAGYPLLLSASDEELLRAWYAEFIEIAAKEVKE